MAAAIIDNSRDETHQPDAPSAINQVNVPFNLQKFCSLMDVNDVSDSPKEVKKGKKNPIFNLTIIVFCTRSSSLPY